MDATSQPVCGRSARFSASIGRREPLLGGRDGGAPCPSFGTPASRRFPVPGRRARSRAQTVPPASRPPDFPREPTRRRDGFAASRRVFLRPSDGANPRRGEVAGGAPCTLFRTPVLRPASRPRTVGAGPGRIVPPAPASRVSDFPRELTRRRGRFAAGRRVFLRPSDRATPRREGKTKALLAHRSELWLPPGFASPDGGREAGVNCPFLTRFTSFRFSVEINMRLLFQIGSCGVSIQFVVRRAHILSPVDFSHYFPPMSSSHHISHPIIIMTTNNTNNAVPPIWPGEARKKIRCQHGSFILAVMQLVEKISPHFEVGCRNSTSIQK